MLNKQTIKNTLKPLTPQQTTLTPTGKLHQKVECLLFDVYGTLFISGSGDIGITKNNSKNFWKLEPLLRKYAVHAKTESVLNDFFSAIEYEHEKLKKTGVDYPEVKIENIWMQVLGKDDIEQAKAFAVEFEIIANPVYPMPHLKELLSICKEKQILMGIISNAQFYTPLLFEWFLTWGLTDLGFVEELILFSYRFGYAKPSSFLFQLAAERIKRMNYSQHSVLYVGNDMLNDIYPAQSAGFNTALFAGDLRSLRLRQNEPKCKNVSPDIVITDLIQILDHIA
jgi:putative hydrolase of the HAD superfamily